MSLKPRVIKSCIFLILLFSFLNTAALAEAEKATAAALQEITGETSGNDGSSPLPAAMKPETATPDAFLTGTQPTPTQTADTSKSKAETTILQKGDEISIEISPQSELNASLLIDEEGMIEMPYIGNVRAEGLSPDQLASQLREALGKNYLNNPAVKVRRLSAAEMEEEELEVTPEEPEAAVSAKPVIVLGEVIRPTNYYMPRPDATILEAIMSMGGFTPMADTSGIQLKRIVDGKQTTSVYDLKTILDGKQEDPVAQQGDIVIVPSRTYSGETSVNVLGEVMRPGMIPLSQFLEEQEGATLIKIISMAGGFTRAAALTRVRIVRLEDGKEKAIRVNAKKILKGKAPDIHPKAGDVIVVPESYW